MLILRYDPVHGSAIRDGDSDSFANDLINMHMQEPNDELIRVIATENVFYSIRASIKQRKIHHEDVLVEFNGQYGAFDKDARSEFWPDGFCDFTEKKLLLLIGW